MPVSPQWNRGLGCAAQRRRALARVSKRCAPSRGVAAAPELNLPRRRSTRSGVWSERTSDHALEPAHRATALSGDHEPTALPPRRRGFAQRGDVRRYHLDGALDEAGEVRRGSCGREWGLATVRGRRGYGGEAPTGTGARRCRRRSCAAGQVVGTAFPVRSFRCGALCAPTRRNGDRREACLALGRLERTGDGPGETREGMGPRSMPSLFSIQSEQRARRSRQSPASVERSRSISRRWILHTRDSDKPSSSPISRSGSSSQYLR